MKIWNKNTLFAIVLCTGHAMAADQINTYDPEGGSSKSSTQTSAETKTESETKPDSKTVAGAAQILFNELELQGYVPPTAQHATAQSLPQTQAAELEKKRAELEEKYKKGELSHADFYKQLFDLNFQVSAKGWEKVAPNDSTLNITINGLVEAIFMDFLKKNHTYEKESALDVNAKNTKNKPAFTISDMKALAVTSSNSSTSSSSNATYGNFESNPNQFKLTSFTSNSQIGSTNFNVVAQFCGIDFSCSYGSSHRFYVKGDDSANKHLFNNGRTPNRDDITVTVDVNKSN